MGKVVKRKVATGTTWANVVIHIASVHNLKIVNVKPDGPKKMVRKEALVDFGQVEEEEHEFDEGEGETHSDNEDEDGNEAEQITETG